MRFAAFILGFSLMPTVIGLIAGFATLSIHFNLDKSYIALGAAVGLAIEIVGAACIFAFGVTH